MRKFLYTILLIAEFILVIYVIKWSAQLINNPDLSGGANWFFAISLWVIALILVVPITELVVDGLQVEISFDKKDAEKIKNKTCPTCGHYPTYENKTEKKRERLQRYATMKFKSEDYKQIINCQKIIQNGVEITYDSYMYCPKCDNRYNYCTDKKEIHWDGDEEITEVVTTY